jgi:hypothetical protein
VWGVGMVEVKAWWEQVGGAFGQMHCSLPCLLRVVEASCDLMTLTRDAPALQVRGGGAAFLPGLLC